jgi:hypothetical protein
MKTNLASRSVQDGQPLSIYADSVLRHAVQVASGDRTEDHGAAITRNLQFYESTRQRVMDGKLPVHLADHAGEPLSEMLTAIAAEEPLGKREQRKRKRTNSSSR